MKSKVSRDKAVTVAVLVTVDEKHREALDIMATRLAKAGLEVVDKFALGGVISGNVPVDKLAALERVDGVATVEKDQPLTAGG